MKTIVALVVVLVASLVSAAEQPLPLRIDRQEQSWSIKYSEKPSLYHVEKLLPVLRKVAEGEGGVFDEVRIRIRETEVQMEFVSWKRAPWNLTSMVFQNGVAGSFTFCSTYRYEPSVLESFRSAELAKVLAKIYANSETDRVEDSSIKTGTSIQHTVRFLGGNWEYVKSLGQ